MLPFSGFNKYEKWWWPQLPQDLKTVSLLFMIANQTCQNKWSSKFHTFHKVPLHQFFIVDISRAETGLMGTAVFSVNCHHIWQYLIPTVTQGLGMCTEWNVYLIPHVFKSFTFFTAGIFSDILLQRLDDFFVGWQHLRSYLETKLRFFPRVVPLIQLRKILWQNWWQS